MALPTPPSTSHRAEKENHPTPRPSGSRVVWSQENQYHSISNEMLTKLPFASSSCNTPTRSILKKSTTPVTPASEEEERDATPEPEDPLANLSYLDTPVSKIIATDASLCSLIEAYSILAARLRTSVEGTTDADASWPLFQPLRKYRQDFVDSVVRDLGRALNDPITTEPTAAEALKEETAPMLPSPRKSPKKKKGMSAEQAKYARDLCTTSHAVMKMLAVVFTLPAIFRVFTDEQLRAMITQLLAIPLASELPTPNARKTCALAIWLLQAQRLPAEVLDPAKDRIAYALRRGIEGELGKEGKKGSASDGLKAIHDLSTYQPETFIQPFTELLPSVLANLLAPSVALRVQAAHALGGFALGSAEIPRSSLHTCVSTEVVTFLTTPSPTSKPGADPTIIRTLRTVLSAADPPHVAHGPVWALNVLASLIVLVGPAFCKHSKLTRMISGLLATSMLHKKSSVRALTCLVWRCVTWAYFQLPSPPANGESSASHGVKTNDEWWKVVKSVVDMGAGVATIVALASDGTNDPRCSRDPDTNLSRIMDLLLFMIKKGGQTCEDAMAVLQVLVSTSVPQSEWCSRKLLPSALFSAIPGLLTVDFKNLVPVLKPIMSLCPQTEDVKPLSSEDVCKEWVFDGLVKVWRAGLACLNLREETDLPSEITDIWENILKSNVSSLQSAGDIEGATQFAIHAVDILVDILQDPNLDLTTATDGPSNPLATSPVKPSSSTSRIHTRSNGALKLLVLRSLWSTTRTVFPHALLSGAGERLLLALADGEDDIVMDAGNDIEEVRKAWAYLCANICTVCEAEEIKAFWGSLVEGNRKYRWSWPLERRQAVWEIFIDAWKTDVEGGWEGAVALLDVPFSDTAAWEVDDEVLSKWEAFLQHTTNKALDYGVDALVILDHVASTIALSHVNPDFASATRIADLLLSNLDFSDIRQLPIEVLDFVNDTLFASYPPEPRNKVTSCWVLRSLTRAIDTCPSELHFGFFEKIQDGLCKWISDECEIFTQKEYNFDVLPLYQTTLATVQTMPRAVDALDRLSQLISSVFDGRKDKPEAIIESFVDFWTTTYGDFPIPEDGWPHGIQTCLDTILPPSVTPVELPTPNEEDPVAEKSETNIQHTIIDRSVNTLPPKAKPSSSSPFFGNLGPAFFTPSGEMDVSPSLSTSAGSPRPSVFKALEPPSSPIRARVSKSDASPSFLLFKMPIAYLPSTPKRNHHSGMASPLSSLDRKRIAREKENLSPIASVTDRIASTLNNSTGKSSTLGKRRAAQEWQEGSMLKKAKIAVPDNDSEDERLVEFSLLCGTPSRRTSGKTLPAKNSTSPALPSSSKKRKGIFMDAVELPTLRDVQKERKKLRSFHSLDTARSVMITPSRRSLTRSKSLGQATSAVDSQKRRRRSDQVQDDVSHDLFSSPLRALENIKVIVNSDDSIVFEQPLKEQERSDDDPHIGQVTPHHLISPALRRIQHFDSDPPSSDDSIMSVSPTRDLTARRLQGSTTSTYFKPSPFNVRMSRVSLMPAFLSQN